MNRKPVAFPIANSMNVLAGDRHASGARHVAARDELEERCLPGSVRPADAERARPVDAEVGGERKGDRARQPALPIPLLQSFDCEQRGAIDRVHEPRTAARSARSPWSADAGPACTIVPARITYTRSATPSAVSTFCSTTSDATPSPRSRRIVAMTSWTTF